MSNNRHDEGRRRFMTGLGALGVGAAAGGLGVLAAGVGGAQAAQEIPEGQWPYKPMDPDAVAKRAHLGYYQGECSYGVFDSLVGTLQDSVGFPYTMIPTRMMHYGGGGVAGWCTFCGALNGACAAIGLISEDEKVEKALCDELLKWYVKTPIPSQKSNDWAVNHEFLVDKYKSDKALAPTVSHSPLCHVTVTLWCKESGFASGSSERSERCARSCADVAAFTADILNKAHAGAFASAYDYSDTVKQCRTCHKKGKDFDAGQWTRGKMDCGGCHIDGKIKVVGADHYPPG